MCRLYGFRANEPTKVECTLVHAQNALLSQSRANRHGKSHEDGWGIACYDNSSPRRERRAAAAFADLWFSTTAERVYSHAVIAHVRRATVGANLPENSHPFICGPWTFAHNGTVTAFERVGERIERETAPRFSKMRKGTTDSELVFGWLLTRMSEIGVGSDQPCNAPQRLADLVGDSVRLLAQWCDQAGAETPARLNFLLTDGQVLIATRWNNTLYWVERHGVHDCEICGIPHVRHHAGADYRAFVVASEPISHEAWQELPERSLLFADSSLRAEVHSL